MAKLHFEYDMKIEYSEPVARCNFTIKCIPGDTARQKISDVKISLTPPTIYNFGKDGLGNTQIYGANDSPHDLFIFHIEGNALTGLENYEDVEDTSTSMIYRHPHGLNVAGENILYYHRGFNFDEDLTSYGKAKRIMYFLHRDFEYKPCTTDVNTTADEAFAQGFGVCQDYAHIFIALCHLEKITARYVTGLIIGEGQSHAWVEVLQDGKWYGFDPTHDCMVDEKYIKIGVGRDARDCALNRGIMHGGGLHTQTIDAKVAEQ